MVKIMDTKVELNLNQFIGTENWYKHQLSGYTYTDGVKYVADQCKAYWLIDKILIVTKYKSKLQEFGVWKLTVKDDKAKLVCEDGNHKVLYTERITYTDFPVESVELWFENGVLILPSEH